MELNKKAIRRLSISILLLLLVTVLFACGQSDDSSSKDQDSSNADNSTENSADSGEDNSGLNLVAATHDQQTASYVFTAALAEILREQDGVNLEVLPYAGGVGNVELVNNGDADFGISFNIAAKWGKDGEVEFDKPHENISSLGAAMGYYNVGIIAREDFLDKNDITSLQDVVDNEIPVNLITNESGSLAEVIARLTLESYGLDYQTLESFGGTAELTSSDVIQTAMQDGTADMYIMTLSAAHAVITEMSLQTDIRMIGVEEPEVLDYFEDKGFITSASYDASEYGQEEVINSPGFNVSYIINNDVDEDVAYLLAKRLSENQPALANAHAIMEEFDPSIAGHSDINTIELHPGAYKYYEEVGALD